MNNQKIILAGGSGYLGQTLANYFNHKGFEIIILSRKLPKHKQPYTYLLWDGKTIGAWQDALEGSLAVINLAGKSVNCRYNEENKKAIYASRQDSTRVLGKAIQECEHPPKVWLNSSSATIYRHAEDRPMDEFTGDIGKGFSVDVCQKWEQAFEEMVTPSTRKVVLRTSLVLGKGGGVYPTLAQLAKIGLGGTQGSGKQMVSWIAEQDFLLAVDFLIQRESLAGVFNLASPNPIPNQLFTKAIRKSVKCPLGIPLKTWMVTLGTFAMGTENELVLKSRWVVPTRLLNEGFEFLYPEVKMALEKL